MSAREIDLAAKMFTVENLGGEVRDRSVQGIKRAYDECASDHGSEGIDIIGEYNDWAKNFRNADPGTIKMWEKERPTIKGLADFLGKSSS